MTEDKRENYLVYASYDEQVQGIIKVPARDAEHAKELVTKAYSKALNFVIVDVCAESQVAQPEVQEPEHDLFQPKLNEKKVTH